MRLLIAGGGTGGHVFPGLAVAEELVQSQADSALRFVGTARGFEARAVPAAGFELDLMEISGIKGMGLKKTATAMLQIPRAGLRSRQIIKDFNPEVVLGVGGYASGPLLATAVLMGIPTAICEQNSVPGLTNKILGRLVDAVFGSFAHSAQFFSPQKFHLVGNPLRRQILQAQTSSMAADDAELQVLVMGGSQGARPLNNKLPKALAALIQAGHKLKIRHQCGPSDMAKLRKAYAELGIDAQLEAFIDDMAAAYADCDVFIGRAGATTCAELAALGVPSVLIPFPQAADDHQTLNARDLEQAGAAIVLAQKDLNAENISRIFSDLNKEKRQKMSRAAQHMGKADAAQVVVRGLQNLAQGLPVSGAEAKS